MTTVQNAMHLGGKMLIEEVNTREGTEALSLDTKAAADVHLEEIIA